jgi:hypothetical protein
MAAMTKSRPRGTLITRKAQHLEAATSASRRFEILQMERKHLTLKCASAFRPFDEGTTTSTCSRDGAVMRGTFKANAVRGESPWMWTLLFRIAPGDGLAFTNREAPVSRGEIGAALCSAIDDLDQ